MENKLQCCFAKRENQIAKCSLGVDQLEAGKSLWRGEVEAAIKEIVILIKGQYYG